MMQGGKILLTLLHNTAARKKKYTPARRTHTHTPTTTATKTKKCIGVEGCSNIFLLQA